MRRPFPAEIYRYQQRRPVMREVRPVRWNNEEKWQAFEMVSGFIAVAVVWLVVLFMAAKTFGLL